MFELIIGYAIGTAQIVGLEWLRDRRTHRRFLRTFKSELQRLQEFHVKFRLRTGSIPRSDALPAAPSLGAGYLSTVQGIEWQLTDEHQDDNSQLTAITIDDLCSRLGHYHSHFVRNLEEAKTAAQGPPTLEALTQAIEYSQLYDADVDQFQYIIHDALRDTERRLQECRLRRQVLRAFRPLPVGTNPEMVEPDDPRVIGFADNVAAQRTRRGRPDA